MGLKSFVEGGMASIVAGCTTHPLDLIKVRMQLQGEASMLRPVLALGASGVHALRPPTGVIEMAVRVVRSEGLPALFNGVSATCLRQSLYSTTRMGLYEVLKNRWADPSQGSVPVFKKVAAGLIAGGVGAAVGNPADVAMVRMQADGRLPNLERRNYKSVTDALIKMVRQEGVSSLWRGASLTIQRAMVVTTSQLATYDQVKESLISHKITKDGLPTHVAASCTAGLVAAVSSNPIDVIKTRIMNMKTDPGKLPPYSGMLDCAMKTINGEGPMALYKGFVPTVTRQGPFTVVLFVSLEQIRKLMERF
eukprot:c28547_g1_i3 orf=141-1061(+)